MASPAMAAIPSIISPSLSPKSLKHCKRHAFNFKFATYRSLETTQIIRTRCSQSASTTASQGPEFDISEEESMSIDNLRRFINLNLGTWTGSFHQFDGTGNLLHKIRTKLAAGSYGEDELISLIQTLYIKQPLSSVSVSGDDEEPQWAEYKIKESNMFTVDKYQQINFFPKERAFALRYQTAGMLDYILRQGVLGEDDIGEEFPRKLKLPSRRPSLVCESCLYSLEKDRRARAFHIMDPKGALDMLFIFLEERGGSIKDPPSLGKSEDTVNRIQPFLGHWKGHSVTNRSGVYGATIAEHETVSSFEMGDNGQLVQGITSTSKGGDEIKTNVHWTGTISENVVMFDGGFQRLSTPFPIFHHSFPTDKTTMSTTTTTTTVTSTVRTPVLSSHCCHLHSDHHSLAFFSKSTKSIRTTTRIHVSSSTNKPPSPSSNPPSKSVKRKPNNPSKETVYFDGGAHYGDLLANLILGFTLLWLPLTLAAVFRAFFLRYRFTNLRVTVISGFTGQDRSDFSYEVIKDVQVVPRFIGEWGDIVITLKDGTKVDLRSVPKFREIAKYCLSMAEKPVVLTETGPKGF